MSRSDVCVCGHNIQEHASNGTCIVQSCLCGGFKSYEEDLDDEKDSA